MNTQTNTDLSTAKQVRILFKNYRRMKMEILQLSESIDFLSKNMEQSVESDIYTASVSHGTGGIGGGSAHDKLPKIAERVEEIRMKYDENMCLMNRKKSIFERTVASIDIFADSLEWSDRTIIRRRFINEDKKSLEEISNEIHLTASAVKKRIVKLMLGYAESVHFNISVVIDELE